MRDVTLAVVCWLAVLVIALLYVLVARNDRRHNATAEPALWVRSLDEYKARARRRQVEQRLGRIRPPVPRRMSPHELN